MSGLKKKIQLLRGLIGSGNAYTGPFYIRVDITTRCNMSCPGCRHHSSQLNRPVHVHSDITDIPFELIERLCKEIPKLAVNEVIIVSGGEPFLHPRLFDIISAFKKTGCKVQLFTNGTLINKVNATLLMETGLDILKVSLWTNSKDEYEKCHPNVDPDNFHKTIQGIKTITGLKIKYNSVSPAIFLKQPLNRYNYRSLNKRITIAEETGCDGLEFDTYRHREFTEAALSIEEINILKKDLVQLKKRLQSSPLRHNIDTVMQRLDPGPEGWSKQPCYIGYVYTKIDVDGTIYPCLCPKPMGNLYEKSLEQIWNDTPYRTFRNTVKTAEGLLSLSRKCHCDWCCHLKDNIKIHRFFKYLSPFVRSRTKDDSNRKVL